MQACERRARDGPHLTDRWQLAGSACSFSFVSPSVFSIKNGIRPEPEGVEASTKSDSYLMVVGRGGKRGEGRGGVTKIGAVVGENGAKNEGESGRRVRMRAPQEYLRQQQPGAAPFHPHSAVSR